MRRSKINLAVSREDYQKYEQYFAWLRISLFMVLVFFLVIFLTFFVVLKNKYDKNNGLRTKKESLLVALKDKKGDEAKLFYLQKKYGDLETFLKDDAASLPYYTLLANALKESSESSTIKSFAINKSREASFTIAFTSFSELNSFFKFIESEIFLKNFEAITLKNFSVIGAQEETVENYEISFDGRFKNVQN